MRGRPSPPANDAQTRQTKRSARDAQSGAVKAAGHQGAETADGAETAQTGPEMAGDEPGDGVETVGEGQEAGDVSREPVEAGSAAEPGDAHGVRSPHRSNLGHPRRAGFEAPAGAPDLRLRLWQGATEP
jgi:hypothetical protein